MVPHLTSPVPLLYMQLSLTTDTDRSISPATDPVLGTRATYNQVLLLHATQVTFSPVPVELLCPVLASFMSI